jgi:uncharacterized coiled-coil protein SlyX
MLEKEEDSNAVTTGSEVDEGKVSVATSTPVLTAGTDPDPLLDSADGSPVKENDVEKERVIASLLEEVDDLRTRANDLEVINFGGMSDFVQELSAKDAKIADLQSQVEEANRRINELEIEMTEKTAFVDDLSEKLDTKNGSFERSEARVQKLTKDLENIQIQVRSSTFWTFDYGQRWAILGIIQPEAFS